MNSCTQWLKPERRPDTLKIVDHHSWKGLRHYSLAMSFDAAADDHKSWQRLFVLEQMLTILKRLLFGTTDESRIISHILGASAQYY